MDKKPAVFFDRGGGLIVERGYICRRDELEWYGQRIFSGRRCACIP